MHDYLSTTGYIKNSTGLPNIVSVSVEDISSEIELNMMSINMQIYVWCLFLCYVLSVRYQIKHNSYFSLCMTSYIIHLNRISPLKECSLHRTCVILTLTFYSFQTYVKEILKEICIYNMKAPHKNMWEMKPEYRHYKTDS